MGRKKGFQK